MSRNPSLDLDNLCENIRNNFDLSGFSHIEFDNLGKIENNQVEEVVYDVEHLKNQPISAIHSDPFKIH